MEEIKWIAGNGKEVVVRHVTERQNIADHTVINKVDEIEITLGGEMLILRKIKNGMIITHGVTIRVPEGKERAIEMVEECENRRRGRMAATSKVDREYAANKNKTKGMME